MFQVCDDNVCLYKGFFVNGYGCFIVDAKVEIERTNFLHIQYCKEQWALDDS